VLEPERQEEVIGPVKITSSDFGERLLELGHSKAVRLFSYSRAKTTEMQGPSLIIEQDDTNSRHGAEEYVRFELTESGRVLLDSNVTGRSGGGSAVDMMQDAFVIDVQSIDDVLAAFFRFSSALYAELDPHQRHERFFYNVGLRGLGHRVLERNPRPKQSHGMSMRNSDAIVAFRTARQLSRSALAGPPRTEIDRAIALLEREARD
jgi:hypothetical protein